MAIQDVDLGEFSAEKDTNLGDYFLEDTSAYKSAEEIEDYRYILVGRTGSGKSAILSHLEQKFKDDNKYLCAFIKPSDKNFLDLIVQTDDFLQIKSIKGLQNVIFKVIWQYAIIATILREKYRGKNELTRWKLIKGTDLKAYRFLKKTNQLADEEKTFTDILSELIKEVSIKIGGVGTISVKNSDTKPSLETVKEIIKETQNFHKGDFWNIVRGSKVYILFDDLDIGWNPEDENQQMLLRGLFSVMKDYAYRKRVKPLVALRTNILDELDLKQAEKYESNILRIRWSKEKLEKMLLLRLKKYTKNKKIRDLKDFFEINDSENPVNYMIERTLYRPRDLLAFCKYAISEAHIKKADKVSINHVLAAQLDYSKSRNKALADEWRNNYSGLETLITEMVRTADKLNLGNLIIPKELNTLLVTIREKIHIRSENKKYSDVMWIWSFFPGDDPLELVKILYKIGILGFQPEVKGDAKFVYKTEDILDIYDVTEDSRFVFHPMIRSREHLAKKTVKKSPWI
ncbi:MAG: hypothetical protein F6K41_33055 [Symploca sp. SIO3E6]|nr:hypothetical protein [Caldora sp. SIO3E6]